MSSPAKEPRNTYVTIAFYSQETRDRMGIQDEKDEDTEFLTPTWFLSKLIGIYQNSAKNWHCEIAFPHSTSDVDGTLTAYGVADQIGVFSKKRQFNTPGYEYVMLDITQRESQIMRDALRTQLNKECTKLGAVRMGIWPRKTHAEQENWFCSELVTWALQQIGMLAIFEPGEMEIDHLRALVEKSNRKSTRVRLTPKESKDLRTSFNTNPGGIRDLCARKNKTSK